MPFYAKRRLESRRYKWLPGTWFMRVARWFTARSVIKKQRSFWPLFWPFTRRNQQNHTNWQVRVITGFCMIWYVLSQKKFQWIELAEFESCIVHHWNLNEKFRFLSFSLAFRHFYLSKVHKSRDAEKAVTIQKFWTIQKWSLFRCFYIWKVTKNARYKFLIVKI